MADDDRDAPLLSRRAVLGLGAGVVLAAAGAGVALVRPGGVGSSPLGISTASPQATGSFTFQPPGLAPIPAHYALGAGDPRTATLVVVMHGDERNAVEYRDVWAALVRERNAVVVVPQFDRSGFPGSRGYNQGGVLDRSGHLLPAAQWTFAYIEPLFREMRDRIGGRQTSFDLFGHSAGAQFVHRYVELAPTLSLRRAVAANAGWYTMTDPAVAYPYGAGGPPEDLFDWPATFGTHLTVMLGDADVLDDNLRHDDGADAQGPTRWQRGHNFFDRARSYAATLGLPIAWTLHEVAGIGHDYQAMSAQALDLLL